MATECCVVEDPGDPLVRPAAALASRYWREALGPAEPDRPASELPWQLTVVGGRRFARLLVLTDGGTVRAAALQQLGWEEQGSSWLAWGIVDPQFRRRGLGTRLLEAAADLARGEGRVRLDWNTPSPGPGPAAFSEAAGAERRSVIEQNRVKTSSLDRARLSAWAADNVHHATYELVSWDGPCPEGYLDAFVQLSAVMDEAPGNLPMAGRDRERLRLTDARELLRGPSWRLCVQDRADGAFVGYTELRPPDGPPWVARQGDTGVVPEHRHRGLGRRLKALNALRLLDERPEATAIETFNAEGNESMLAVNRAMGFEVVCRWQQWTLSL